MSRDQELYMKDVEKTNVERNNSRKRIRRRRRWMNVYGLVVLILVLTAGVTISYTFLFNINEIRVSGESDMYTAEEIVNASGIKEGDNLLRLDTKKSEQLILDNLLYVETAVVDRDFPSSLEIRVTRCVPAFNVHYDEGTLLVSRKGKILADNGFITDGLPIIYGYEPSVTTPGKGAVSSNEHKDEAFSSLIKSLEANPEIELATVDMSDEHSIIVNYKNGMIFKMGNWTDVDYKLNLALTVMNDESVKGKKGYLTMIGTHQCSFRTSDDPVEVPGMIEPTTSKTTDENGKPVEEDEPIGESNPEQEAIFSEYNNRDDEDDGSSGDDYSDTQSDWSDDGQYDWSSGQDDWSGGEQDWNDYSGDYGNDWSGGGEWDDGGQQW